jgi:hypothetical protein
MSRARYGAGEAGEVVVRDRGVVRALNRHGQTDAKGCCARRAAADDSSRQALSLSDQGLTQTDIVDKY